MLATGGMCEKLTQKPSHEKKHVQNVHALANLLRCNCWLVRGLSLEAGRSMAKSSQEI